MEANFALAASSKPGAAMTSRKSLCISSAASVVDRAIDADHAAESRDWIAFQGSLVRFGESLAGGSAARVGVFDDGDDGLFELLREIPRGLQVDDVVVGEFLALKLAAIGDAHA